MLSTDAQEVIDSFKAGWSMRHPEYGKLQEELTEFIGSSNDPAHNNAARIHGFLAICLQLRGHPTSSHIQVVEDQTDINVIVEYYGLLLISLMRSKCYRTSTLAEIGAKNAQLAIDGQLKLSSQLLPRYRALCRLGLALYLYRNGGDRVQCKRDCTFAKSVLSSEANVRDVVAVYAVSLCDKLLENINEGQHWWTQLWKHLCS